MRKPTLSSHSAQPLAEEAGHRQISELRGKGYWVIFVCGQLREVEKSTGIRVF
jgi:hypothetical protein